MSNLAYLRDAIIGVCEGQIGVVRTVTINNAFAIESPLNERARALIKPRFDVKISNGKRHSGASLGVSDRELMSHDITIEVTHPLKPDILEAARVELRGDVETLLDQAYSALTYPGNVEEDPDGNATGAVSGMLFGNDSGWPSWEITRETKDMLASRIRATAIVQHTRAIT